MAKTKKRKGEHTEEIVIEFPSVPNFPYQRRDVAPPVGLVLILATEGGYILGEWDGVYFFDNAYTKVEPVYGKVLSWCVLFADDGDVILADREVG